MGKFKGGKKSKAGSNFSSVLSRKPNPFEEKIIKEKQQTFGRPHTNAKGRPGASRSQACHKRNHTLLYEYEQQHKTNSILDRRIGEKNRFISQEDKTVARYAAVRAKHKHKQLYNLEGNEILTHNGQTLNEIEKFEDPRSDDDVSDDDNDAFKSRGGKLDKNFVSEAHFGGGMLSRKSKNEEPKSYKDIINQLITDSKKRKVEKQREKECTQDLTDKLDSEWKDLLPLMTNQSKASIQQDDTPGVDKYDKFVQELRFEARGNPSDKLKTSAEIAADAAKTREALEIERLARMQGPCFRNETPKHRSADDLFDNCTTFNTNDDEEDHMLTYNEEGTLINTDTNLETLDGDNIANIDEKAEEEAEESSANEEKSSEDEHDRFSDLQSDSGSDVNVPDDCEDISIKPEPLKLNSTTSKSFPKTYDDFQQIFENLPCNEYDRKLNQLLQYAKTTPNRKDDINFLLISVLQFILDEKGSNPFVKCNHLIPGMYELVQVDPETACSSFVERLQAIKAEYATGRKIGVCMLLWLRIVVCVFSVSDFRHAVATPTLVVLEEILGKATVRLRSTRDVAGGLFLAALMLEFTWISKRFSPALIQFLTSIIRCTSKEPNKLNKMSNTAKDLLLLTTNNSSHKSFPLKIDLSYLSVTKKNSIIGDDFKITSLYVTLKLLQTAYSQLKSVGVPSRCEAFVSATHSLNTNAAHIRSMYPEGIITEMDAFLRIIKDDTAHRRLEYLTMEKKRPKPLRLYEPNIKTIYDRKVYGPKGDKSERNKLMYKLKQERKGALREIRKDITFLGRHRIRHQIKSDNERKANVKKIYAEAAIQQSDLNSLKRMNKN